MSRTGRGCSRGPHSRAEARTLEWGGRLGPTVPASDNSDGSRRASAQVEESLCCAGSELAGMAGQSDRAPGPRLWWPGARRRSWLATAGDSSLGAPPAWLLAAMAVLRLDLPRLGCRSVLRGGG